MKQKINRRQFVNSVGRSVPAVLGFPYIIPSSVRGYNDATPPSDRIVMGCIGVGNMGTGHVRSFLSYDDVHITAICDVRKSHRDRAKDMVNNHYGNKDCATCNDFREILARKDIDAVLIAVPDHWHALIGLEAARNGKHMYYEKPMSMSIAESKAVREAVKRYNVVFQFGTQQRSDDRFRLACELVRNEKIGKLETIMIGSANYKPIPDQPEQPVPEGFDYEMWLGPAPVAPYTFERCTRNWTLIRDYSLGCVSGAWGIHHVDIAQWANNSDDTGPIETEGYGVFPDRGLYDTAIVWEVEHMYANGVKLVHMDMPTALKRAEQFNIHWMGILFLGSEGWVYVCRELIKTGPESLVKIKFNSTDERLPRSVDHRRNFLDAVKNRRQTISPIDAAARSDMICHHADIAMRLGRKLFWDPVKEEFVNDAEANRLFCRPMRSPWHL
ncbi:Gfo/Idh/MocA family oxidoreductase [candidate division KSB1 bacterium]|nr:Gfo/Idh/MocA family oxidoreductase [candidate division KSB1 bacterium]